MRGLLSSNLLSKNALSGNAIYMAIASTYELLADTTISGSAVTSVNFGSLSLGKSDEILLVSTIVRDSATDSEYVIYVNNNTTPTNYYTQEIYANNAAISASRLNRPFFQYRGGNDSGMSMINIKLTNSGYIALQSRTIDDSGVASVNLKEDFITSTFTATSITQFTITASLASGISIGSRFQLYRIAGGA